MDKKMKRKLLLELDWLVRNKGDKNKIRELQVKLGIVEDEEKESVNENKSKFIDTTPFKLKITKEEYLNMRLLNISLREIAFIKGVAYNTIYNFRNKNFGSLKGENKILFEMKERGHIFKSKVKYKSKSKKYKNKPVNIKQVISFINDNCGVIHIKPAAEQLETSPYRFKQHVDYLFDNGYLKEDYSYIKGMDVKGYSKTDKFKELKDGGN